MAAGSFTLYDNGKELILDSTFNLNTGGDTIAAILLLTGYTPSAAHDEYSDVSAQICIDGDYGNQTLGSQDITRSGGTVTWDAANVSYGASVTITAKYIALVVGNPASLGATDKLIGYMDLDTGGGSVSSAAAVFQVNWNTSGIFTAV